jgi:hypothetical protein
MIRIQKFFGPGFRDFYVVYRTNNYTRFNVLRAVKMLLLFWVLTSCGLVGITAPFRRNMLPPSLGPEDGLRMLVLWVGL